VVAALAGFAGGLGIAQTPGSLDPTFGTGGIVMDNFGGHNVMPLTAIEQSDGKIVVITGIDNVPNATEAFGLVRFTSKGEPDKTFGTNGVTLAIITDFLNEPSSVAVQPDGDIVLAGTSVTTAAVSGFVMMRFTPDGRLDTTFGDRGKVTVQPPGAEPFAAAVIVQPNNQILLSGSVNNFSTTVLGRYNSDGSLDTTFGTGGFAEATNHVGPPSALALLADGSYLAVGQSGLDEGQPARVAEFSSTGVLQPKVTPNTVVAANGGAVWPDIPAVFQPNGDYIVGGLSGADDQIRRFLETGKVDSSFSSTPFGFPGGEASMPQTLALQSNGQILVGGIPFGVARLNSDGELDTTFGSGGIVETPGGQVIGLLAETDGKILAIGAGGPNGTEELVLARYLAN
jgi:uncharacterized delta-60 repeat protein